MTAHVTDVAAGAMTGAVVGIVLTFALNSLIVTFVRFAAVRLLDKLTHEPSPAREPEQFHRTTAPVAVILATVTFGLHQPIARADNLADERRQQDATVQPTVQIPPPARIILPAPWEPATPARPATAPTASAGPKK